MKGTAQLRPIENITRQKLCAPFFKRAVMGAKQSRNSFNFSF